MAKSQHTTQKQSTVDRSHREEPVLSNFDTSSSSKDKIQIYDAVDHNGKEVDRDSDYCVAKVVKPRTRGKMTRYFIKRATSNGSSFFNPFQDSSESLINHRQSNGREKWEFSSVSEDAYTYYVKFLTNGNSTFLASAERLA